MVAVLSPNRSIQATLNYNENKVKANVAVCLAAENFQRSLTGLTFPDKLKYLQKVAAQNNKVQVNCLHAHLNFDPSEKISDEKMQEIAMRYMEKLGFGDQPYLVYRHHDAGHPHCHIVTTNIEISGKRIELHHLGIRRSEPARKEIEQLFGLIKAEEQGHILSGEQGLKPVVYGRSDTRRAIAKVLAGVLKTYRYTSLPELNAVLNQYHISASKGTEGSLTNRHGGLLYQVLDAQRRPVGVPLKASLLPGKPGLKFLERQFKTGEAGRLIHKQKTKAQVELALQNPKVNSLDTFLSALQQQGIHSVLRQNDQGLVYGITFVDHNTKCVFNGSVLGRNYSINAIQERLNVTERQQQITNLCGRIYLDTASFTDALLQEESTYDGLPFDLKRKRRKRKKKQINHSN